MDRPLVLCDLDGVVWRGPDVIPGAVDALLELTRSGCDIVFITNNSNRPVADYEGRLESLGVEATGRVATSALAAASLVGQVDRTMVCAGPGVVDALERSGRLWESAGLHPDECDGPIGAVIVGLHHDFDYRRLSNASAAVRGGARLIGTNTDATFPTRGGEEPGGGSLLAAVATAAGAVPVIAGKPHRPMVDLALAMAPGPVSPERAIVIGDRASTDGEFARALGLPFAYVSGGVAGDRPSERPRVEGATLEVILPDLRSLLVGDAPGRPR
ncbi:MAG: HAD-IIA family hydrolase [Ilumatobacteraceae bacterium]